MIIFMDKLLPTCCWTYNIKQYLEGDLFWHPIVLASLLQIWAAQAIAQAEDNKPSGLSSGLSLWSTIGDHKTQPQSKHSFLLPHSEATIKTRHNGALSDPYPGKGFIRRIFVSVCASVSSSDKRN